MKIPGSLKLGAGRAPRRRSIIVHGHMFKNAGTTFDWSLRRCFQDRFLDHRDDAKMKLGATYLGPFLEENVRLRAISTHALQLPLPNVRNAKLIPAFFLRHPIERARSVYSFERRQPSNTPGSRMAKQLSFAEYVRWRMGPDSPGTLRNLQTRCCIPHVRRQGRRSIGDVELAVAMKMLTATPLVGVVDLFDESMVYMESVLKEDFPDIDLAYIPQNIGHERIAKERKEPSFRMASIFALDANQEKTERRARCVLDSLGSELGQLLLEKNEQDLQLYRQARLLVLDRFYSIDGYQDRLADFRARCEALWEGRAAG